MILIVGEIKEDIFWLFIRCDRCKIMLCFYNMEIRIIVLEIEGSYCNCF